MLKSMSLIETPVGPNRLLMTKADILSYEIIHLVFQLGTTGPSNPPAVICSNSFSKST
jgi:hypothetical protein